MKVTVCELPDDRRAFPSQWDGLVRHAKEMESDLVLLPELPFSPWFFVSPKFSQRTWEDAVEEHTEWTKRFGELGSGAVLGSRPIAPQGKRFNEGFAWTRRKNAGVHRKRYLPNEPGYYEARWYDRGKREFSPFEVSGWKAGYMICSDLWSMANARSYGKGGVELIAAPRCTGTDVEKWLAGGRVASIISGAYCLSSNRTGKRDVADFGGGGWVVDPDGEVLGVTTRTEPFMTVEVDAEKARKAKRTYPRDSLEPD